MSQAALSFTDEYSIELDYFEGPLDLLLHLVQRKDVSVEDVDMTEICEQYLQIVSKSRDGDLERLSEYLVIAATLLALKSERLLPNSSGSYADLLSDLPDGTDPEFLEELRARIRQYELTKRRAKTLLRQPLLGIDTFGRKYKPAEVEEDNFDYESFNETAGLGRMFVSLLHRIGETVQSYKIKLEPVSIVRIMMRSLDFLSGGAKKSFVAMLGSFLKEEGVTGTGGAVNEGKQKGIIIGGFMSLLELMKRGLVEAEQEGDEISISLKMSENSEVPEGLSEGLPEGLSEDLLEDDSVIDMMEYKTRKNTDGN